MLKAFGYVENFKKVIINIVYNFKNVKRTLALRKQLGWFKDH